MVRTAALVAAACAVSGSLAACSSSPQPVSVVAGSTSTSAATPTPTTSPSRPAKPAAEQLPDSKILTVALQIVPGSSTSGQRSVTLTDPTKIAQIAAEINALPTLPKYPKTYCPMIIDGPYLVLAFRDAASGPVLAQVRLGVQPSGRCSEGLQVTVNGVTQPALDDSGQPKLYTQLMQQAGLSVH
jgi:hypothetical protein